MSGASPEPTGPARGTAVDAVPVGPLGSVSRCWLGTAAFGTWARRDTAACRRVVDVALDLGITAFDTADTYSDGEAEEILGRTLASRRDRVVVASKFGLDHRDSTAVAVTAAADVRHALDGSLRRLGTDYLDLYSVHRIASLDQVEVLVPALQALQDAGKIRAYGTSMASPAALQRAHDRIAAHGGPSVMAEQPPYSIFVREIEGPVLDHCRQDGIAVTAFAPLNGGWLTGKYRRGQAPPPTSRASDWPVRRDRYDLDHPLARRKLDLVEPLDGLAAQAGLQLCHLAIGFALSHPDIPVTILGVRDETQLRQLLEPAPAPLAADVRAEIDRLVPPGTTVDHRDTLGYRVTA